MRVVYYTRPAFLDVSISQVEALSRIVAVHLCIELSPESWQSGLLDVPEQNLPPGVHNGMEYLSRWFSPAIRKYWKGCESVSIVVHTHKRSIHPKTWSVSHQVMKHIGNLEPDIVHLDDISMRLAPMLFELNNVPVVLNIHDPRAHSGEQNWRKELARWLTFRRVEHFILHSDFSRKQFLQRYAVPEGIATMIPLGILDIHREWLTSQIPEEPNTVLFFGRISPYKGVQVFVKAAELVSASLPNCRFTIAGRPIDGYSLPDLPQLSRGNAFETYREYLTNAQIANLLSRTSIVVCPYLDASQSAVILTAYAFNKPVIATNVGGLPEYVWEGKTGAIIPPNDPKALAEAIIKALSTKNTELSSSTVYHTLRENELSWKKGADKTQEIYERITRSHR